MNFMTNFHESQASSSYPAIGNDQSLVVDGSSECDDIAFDPLKETYVEEIEVKVLDAAKSKLDRYLDDKCEPMRSKLNVLEWWKINAS
ncbi:hypothetical protein Pint_15719 [Pistacia integerrima]|uniref:Uncharacterized protein n=1 Tax=Pistacia integerrima TaxID=434235 RepID=A0ACC0ZCP9_9ROSI|nr:hypothetical protein Pint_15719 [Pistacia integerrima]